MNTRSTPIRPACHRFQASSGLSGATKNVCWLLALALLSHGCSRGAARIETAPVRGTVTLDGKPLPCGQVVFQPLSGRIAKGIIEDGQFTLGTYEAEDGAVLGRHRVSVTARKTLEDEEPDAPGVPLLGGPSLIPDRYGNSASSGLEFEVTSGDNVFDIELSSRR